MRLMIARPCELSETAQGNGARERRKGTAKGYRRNHKTRMRKHAYLAVKAKIPFRETRQRNSQGKGTPDKWRDLHF